MIRNSRKLTLLLPVFCLKSYFVRNQQEELFVEVIGLVVDIWIEDTEKSHLLDQLHWRASCPTFRIDYQSASDFFLEDPDSCFRLPCRASVSCTDCNNSWLALMKVTEAVVVRLSNLEDCRTNLRWLALSAYILWSYPSKHRQPLPIRRLELMLWYCMLIRSYQKSRSIHACFPDEIQGISSVIYRLASAVTVVMIDGGSIFGRCEPMEFS